MPRRYGAAARRSAVASAVLLALALVGCRVPSESGAAEGGTSFPALSSIPAGPPSASSAEERRAVIEELKKDRAKSGGGGAVSTDPGPDPEALHPEAGGSAD
jgi:hypothetical protein